MLINLIIFLFYIFSQFEKPGRRENFDYPQMAVESVTKALQDAKININKIDQACVGYVYGNICLTYITSRMTFSYPTKTK